MRRPSFQFYPADWQGNTKLKRCTPAQKGAWMDILCLMHDSEEYGILRWTLTDIAYATGNKIQDVEALVEKGVLKGCHMGETCQEFIYIPRHARQNGTPIVLIPAQEGYIWYSSRMVVDEYVRQNAGSSTRFKKNLTDEKDADPSPSQREGERQGDNQGEYKGDGSSSSSSSSSSKKKEKKAPAYIFKGEIIRLNQQDFDKLATTFHTIPDMQAELTAIDAKFSDNPPTQWFQTLTAWLRKKHENNLKAQKAPKPKWTPMPSVAGG